DWQRLVEVQLTDRDESGMILVYAVIAMVVMLGFSALVVDLGLARVERRRMQNAADASALGAAQNLPDLPTVSSQAQAVGSVNLPSRAPDWNNCPEPNPMGYTTPAGFPRCISFDTSFTRVRVRVPRVNFPRLFSGIFGTGLSTSTVAIAEFSNPTGNDVLPF